MCISPAKKVARLEKGIVSCAIFAPILKTQNVHYDLETSLYIISWQKIGDGFYWNFSGALFNCACGA